MNDPTLNQDEIDALLADVSTDGPVAEQAPAAPADDFGIDMGSAPADAGGATDDDLSTLLGGGGSAPAPAPAPMHAPAPAAHAAPMQIPQGGNLEVLLDVPLEVVVELGRSDLQIKDILNLAPGSVVELNRMAGEPIDIMVNGKLVARGEVVVIEESFGVKITSIISPMERLTQLN
jgi:flagellar motor switch protein FliN